MTLIAYQTLRLSVALLVRKAGLSGSYGGIAVELPASAQVIDSLHMLYDEKSGFSSLMKMVDRNPAQTLHERTGADNKPFTLWATMLALSAPDAATGFPAGTVLRPTIFVRNTTAKKQAASITLSWRGDSGKGRVKLPEMTLSPFETRQIQVRAMQKQLGIPDDAHWALVTLATSAMPDELIAEASSYDSTLRYGMQAPFYAGLGNHFVGGEWRVDTNHNTLMAITNVGAKATEALLTLYYNNGKGKYEMQRKIEPGDQMWLNFADLIHRRVADRKGRMLPAELTSGTYDLRDLNLGKGGQLIGSELALDTTLGQQAQPDFLRCCGFENPGPLPNPEELPVDDNNPLDVWALDCNGNDILISPDFNAWWSGNNSVAEVTYKNVYGVGPGSTDGFASGEVPIGNDGYCTVEPVQVQVPITVQVPTSLQYLSCSVIAKTYGTDCTQSDYAIEGEINYQVRDQNGAPIASNLMEPQESINGAPWVDIGPSNYPGTSQYTNAQGQYIDAPVGACSGSPFTNFKWTQAVSILLGGTRYTVRTNNWSDTSTSKSHGSETNGTDVSLSY